MKLTSHIDRWLSKPWGADDQAHAGLYRLACGLLEEGLPEVRVLAVMRRFASRIDDRRITEREIVSALHYAAKRDPEKPVNRWPSVNQAMRAELLSGYGLKDLAAESGDIPPCAQDALGELFPREALLCIGEAANRFHVAKLSELNAPERYQFITPNPMTALRGKTLDGKMSPRTNDNTGPRVYQVIECDAGTFDEHAALLAYLRRYARLCMAVYSGGKSLHGWFHVADMDEGEQWNLMAKAAELGADPKMWTRSQFSRMPYGTNEKSGKRQEVYFFES